MIEDAPSENQSSGEPSEAQCLVSSTEKCVLNVIGNDHTYCSLEDHAIEISEGDECSCQSLLCIKCRRKILHTIKDNQKL